MYKSLNEYSFIMCILMIFIGFMIGCVVGVAKSITDTQEILKTYSVTSCNSSVIEITKINTQLINLRYDKYLPLINCNKGENTNEYSNNRRITMQQITYLGNKVPFNMPVTNVSDSKDSKLRFRINNIIHYENKKGKIVALNQNGDIHVVFDNSETSQILYEKLDSVFIAHQV